MIFLLEVWIFSKVEVSKLNSLWQNFSLSLFNSLVCQCTMIYLYTHAWSKISPTLDKSFISEKTILVWIIKRILLSKFLIKLLHYLPKIILHLTPTFFFSENSFPRNLMTEGDLFHRFKNMLKTGLVMSIF